MTPVPPARRSAKGPRRTSPRLRLQCLEDRSVPATISVTTTADVVAADGQLSLREAITQANSNPDADVIVLPAGVFRIALAGAGEDANATGDFDVTGAVTIRGAGAGKTVVDGRQLDRVFDVLNTAPDPIAVVLEKLTVRGGKVEDNGGGVALENANLLVRDAVVAGNQASGGGGGIYGWQNVALVRSTVARNYSLSSGGGVYAENITAFDSKFIGNYAVYGGGGIYGGTITLNYCTVAGNVAESGYPGVDAYREITLNFCTFRGNSRSQAPTLFVTTTLDVVNPADGLLSLREAITAANASPLPDTIALPAGVYRITRAGAGEDGNATGDLDIASALTIRGAGAGRTIINGRQLDRVFDVHGDSDGSVRARLERLQVRNGKAEGDGGGARVRDAALTVRAAVVAGNQASGSGGGISHANASGFGTVTLARTAVARNAAGVSGGGVHADGVNLTGCTVSDNSAGADGGGVYGDNSASVNESTVRGNRAAGGSGGGVFSGGYSYVNGSTVSGNSAGADGGGVFADDFASLDGSTVSGNSAAASGGGVHATLAYLTNSTVSGNSAGASGGGVFAEGGYFLNATVVKNSALTGGGVFRSPGPTFNLTLQDTIVALNLVGFGGSGPDVSGTFVSGGHNLIGNGTGSTGLTHGQNGNLVGTGAAPIDPLIGDLADNGGPTATHALLPGSPAIDAGQSEDYVDTDQRGDGFPREKDGNGDGVAVADIGAFEL
jgi:predicted outer membrane repeat protein